MKLKKVAIIGRPNVGKSRLFNRLTRHKAAIVLPEPGITRDRLVLVVQWLTKQFELIDTGGISNANWSFQTNINHQAQIAVDESDLILLMVSYQEGLTSEDYYVAKFLKKLKPKKVVVVVNKAENFTNQANDLQQYWKLGFGQPFFISAEHGINIGNLLDYLVHTLKITNQPATNDPVFRFTLIGRPNVGKSSLANAILNNERLIVSNLPGTTRDAVDCYFTYHQQQFCLVDTAGIRKPGQANKLQVERYSVLRAKKAIDRCQCVLLVLDATEINEHDEVIGGLAFQANIPTIIVINKWDLVENKDSQTINKMTKMIRSKFTYLNWAPIVFVSSLKCQRLTTIFTTLAQIRSQLKVKVATSGLEEMILKSQVVHNIPTVQGQKIKLNYAVQVPGQIPTFVIFCNNPQLLHFSYARFIENQIRSIFALNLVPITVYYKSKRS